MGTVFNLTNNGLLPVHEVDQSCGIDRVKCESRRNRLGVQLRPFGHSLGDLGRGATKSLNCENAMTVPGIAEASITIGITYKPVLWP